MQVTIREFKSSDELFIVKSTEELQDYLVIVDQMKFTRIMPEYGESSAKKLLEDVSRNNGIVYVAEDQGQNVGFVAGIIYEWSPEILLECIPLKSGRILELFVESKHRRQNIGTVLMERMEEYFRQNGCDVSRVEVFQPNTEAHNFYENLGYQDRMIDMIKKLKQP